MKRSSAMSCSAPLLPVNRSITVAGKEGGFVAEFQDVFQSAPLFIVESCPIRNGVRSVCHELG
jgi:hypothetical protein